MRLIITRSYDEPTPGEKYNSPFRVHTRLELTPEEKELVAWYKLGGHVLTRSEYSMTTIDDLISGRSKGTKDLNVTMGNEEALRNACAALPEMFEYCRSFGKEMIVDYSPAPTL